MFFLIKFKNSWIFLYLSKQKNVVIYYNIIFNFILNVNTGHGSDLVIYCYNNTLAYKKSRKFVPPPPPTKHWFNAADANGQPYCAL